jgi:hypothetical protein
MDSLTGALSGLQLSSYEQRFADIISFVNSVRPPPYYDTTGSVWPISDDEEIVSQQLASPFTQGGLLILLQDPRVYHPWQRGIEAVCNDCRTLSTLEIDLRKASGCNTTLRENVSVLDTHAFMPGVCWKKLTPNEQRRLESLVAEAIKAKKPDVILCMGKVSYFS